VPSRKYSTYEIVDPRVANRDLVAHASRERDFLDDLGVHLVWSGVVALATRDGRVAGDEVGRRSISGNAVLPEMNQSNSWPVQKSTMFMTAPACCPWRTVLE